jgi:endonuclease/exonuclease/phosphatase family metal-dependent hydrolase
LKLKGGNGMKMRNTKQRFLSRVGCFLILLLFLLGASVTATTLTVAIPIGSKTEWSAVVEKYAKAHPTVDVQLLEFSPSKLRNRIVLDCKATAGQFDLVVIHRKWVSDLAYCLQDLSGSVGKFEIAGSVPVLCDGKVLGGEWPNKSDCVVCVSKQSKNLDHAVALLLAATQGSVSFLTQNTMLLPGVAEVISQRVPCIIDLIRHYDIVGLQEAFKETSQDRIVRDWHTKHLLKTYRVNLHKVILKQKVEVHKTNLSHGQTIIDARPNDRQAQIVFDKHFVMGPDQSDWDQDSGLLILSKRPIITASAFCFKNYGGWDGYANKGVVYARIQVGSSPEEYIHVFNTHLQAHNTSTDKKIRVKQIEELQVFIRKAIGIGQDPEKPDKHPIIVLGDFNIIAADSEYQMLRNNLLTLGGSDWLLDAWTTMKPDSQPDYTWIGISDKPTRDECSPYGTLGNTLADEKAKRQRIDYIFYYGGTAEVSLKPKSMSLVPSGAPKTRILYCFDEGYWGKECEKIYTKGGDLEGRALWAKHYYFQMDYRESFGGTTIPQWLREEFDRRARTWELTGSSSPCRLSENATIRQMDGEDGGRRRTYWLIYDGIKKVYILRKRNNIIIVSKCLFSSHTISDHLGLEMRCAYGFHKQ